MVELDLAPLAYDQVDTSDWLPGYRPYQFQWQAFRLIREALGSDQTLCLFLVTPTGSGKTLGAYAHSILDGEPMMGAYPTNELLADQERALLQEFARTGSNRVFRVDSAALDRWQTDLTMKRHSDALEAVLHWEGVLLTNPDILFYVAFGLYPSLPGLRERLWTLMGKYCLFVFDEFHLYNVKQQADVAFLVGALHAIDPHRGRVFVFASATPNLDMLKVLRERLGVRTEILEAEPSTSSTARTVAHPLHLTLVPSDLDRWQGLASLETHWHLIEGLRQQYPAARWVTIFDSVANAISVANRCRDAFGADAVGEVHGLCSATARSDALAKPMTVGTSTIEVGVDFNGCFEKDFLLFEARTSAQFLQRLGRLARHSKNLPVPNRAVAFVPEYVSNFIRDQLNSAKEISRDRLRVLIEDAYRQPETFGRFLTKHAAVEMAEAATLALGSLQPDSRPEIESAISQVIQGLTGLTLRQAQARRRQYLDEGTLAPLLTFRGAGLQASLIDERAEDVGCPAKCYDLMFLMRRGQYEELAEETYLAELDRLKAQQVEWMSDIAREQRAGQKIPPGPDKLLGVFGFFRLTGLLNQARRVWFEIDQEEIRGKKGQPVVLEGLSLRTDPPCPAQLLNRTLSRKRIVAWVIDSPPNAIKFGRALPPLFAVCELRISLPGGGSLPQPWTIAFNQDAFFLDSLWWNLRNRADTIII